MMLIPAAHAMDASTLGTGSPGGGTALLIILGCGVLLYVLYSAGRKWRKWRLERDGGNH